LDIAEERGFLLSFLASPISRPLWIFWVTMVVTLGLLSHLQAQIKSKRSGVFWRRLDCWPEIFRRRRLRWLKKEC
jgi:hypothetical protein